MGNDAIFQAAKATSFVSLDAVGGIAGDMFCAALLDARPDLWPMVEIAVKALGFGSSVSPWIEPVTDGVISGSRFRLDGVEPETPGPNPGGVDAGDLSRDRVSGPSHTHGHKHAAWRDIRRRLTEATLAPGVRRHALGIFGLLAEAEGRVHGVAPDDVTFHEVGAIDSIVDITAAAAIIEAISPVRWSIGPIPRGAGLIATQHGLLPVPAPATVYLLENFLLFDDGEVGERVTPTGAAILAWLAPQQSADQIPRRLLGSGSGFGTRRLARRPNILRALLHAEIAEPFHETVAELRFEIDDQTGEDLALGLDIVRAVTGVLDISCWAVMGKKGRMAVAVQVLARPEAEDSVVAAVFAETTTLGVRHNRVQRKTLVRQVVDGENGRVKIAERPDAVATAKLEADALVTIHGASAREKLRTKAAEAALAETKRGGLTNERER